MYSLDSGALIDLWRTMPRDIVGTLWERLERMAAEGVIKVSEEVGVELGRQDDGLSEWVKDQNGLIVPTAEVQEVAAEIIGAYPLVDPESTRNQADPFVIAVAEVHEGAVVASEKRAPVGVSPTKIPNVCDDRKIPYLRHLDFLRDAGITL